MSRTATLLLATTCLLAASCVRPNDDSAGADEGPEVLYFEPVGTGQAGFLSDTTEVAIRTAEEWSALADSLRSVEPFRPVDFSQTMLLVAALPEESGGYRVQFESVEKDSDIITASYLVYAPGPDCLTVFALTLPYQVVAVRRAEGSVEFRRRVELESCALD